MAGSVVKKRFEGSWRIILEVCGATLLAARWGSETRGVVVRWRVMRERAAAGLVMAARTGRRSGARRMECMVQVVRSSVAVLGGICESGLKEQACGMF